MSGIGYSFQKLADAVEGKIVSHALPVLIHSVFTDSRKLIPYKNAVFFALKGPQHDAHHYIAELVSKGCRNFVVSDDTFIKTGYGCNVIVVKNTLHALQLLASHHRKQFSIPVIGITGSNGKTIVKEWLFRLLKDDLQITRSPKSYNSQVGVPLSVLQLKEGDEMGIFEAGISMKDEMERLATVICPGTVIITNIGQAHSENFSSLSEKLHEKAKLLASAESVVYCSDDELIENEIQSKHKKLKKYNWSKKKKAFVTLTEVAPAESHSLIRFVFENKEYAVTIPFADHASVENALHCITALLSLGYDAGQLQKKLSLLVPVEMRMEQLAGENNCLLIDDSWSSDIDSLSIALDLLNQQKNYPKKTVILSDILQDKTPDKQLYDSVIALLKNKGVDRLVGIGEKISSYVHLFDKEKIQFSSTDGFLSSPPAFSNEAILIKGARKFGFEKIIQQLQLKAHETVLEIHLDKIAHNLNYYRSKLKPGTRIMVMVKAFSYGSGSTEMATFLEHNRVDYLAVAYADEGVELRKAGIGLPIMVMNPERHSYENMIRYRLEPEIYSEKTWHEFFSVLGKLHPAEPYPVHVKIDSGMSRLGFEPERMDRLTELIRNGKNGKIQSVFTHLAASDDESEDRLTKNQFEVFKNCAEKIESAAGYKIMRHALNSAGISRFPGEQYEMVRLGIGLYGVGTTPEDRQNLLPASVFKTVISQIKTVFAGSNIGYTGKHKAKRNMVTATLPVGYADGLRRSLSNGKGYVLIKGKKAPIAGNVCMDMCMVDITDIENTGEGDEVILFGCGLPAEEFAQMSDTIAYEVFTSVSARVKRVYVRNET